MIPENKKRVQIPKKRRQLHNNNNNKSNEINPDLLKEQVKRTVKSLCVLSSFLLLWYVSEKKNCFTVDHEFNGSGPPWPSGPGGSSPLTSWHTGNERVPEWAGFSLLFHRDASLDSTVFCGFRVGFPLRWSFLELARRHPQRYTPLLFLAFPTDQVDSLDEQTQFPKPEEEECEQHSK